MMETQYGGLSPWTSFWIGTNRILKPRRRWSCQKKVEGNWEESSSTSDGVKRIVWEDHPSLRNSSHHLRMKRLGSSKGFCPFRNC